MKIDELIDLLQKAKENGGQHIYLDELDIKCYLGACFDINLNVYKEGKIISMIPISVSNPWYF